MQKATIAELTLFPLCKVSLSGEIKQHDLIPLEHTQHWNLIKERVFPSFNVGNFEMLVRIRLEKL